ncbi:hypothetical protein BGW38_003181 [Lunasporangiospora selenospora]|uniref:Peptidase S49 domain-containing protein n=1 Tax=Lunasporangiospora selenospora TaxID=979761 RepID=A0A9P6G1B1_9FUNG|nr:hypothetical protein BGW38_003181 [Lunasporangiospora selenospora]
MSTPSRGRKSAVSGSVSAGVSLSQSSPQPQSSSNASPANRSNARNEHDSTTPTPKRPVDQRRSSFSSTRTKHSTYAEADSQWRGIFDDALAKAQQAVQLDEAGETIMSSNLYAQAASDLGRVIPMCSSDKKKQSMLAIQAIYLDRVAQLKAAQLPKSGRAASTQPGTPTPTVGDASSRATQYFDPHPQGMVYGQEDQVLAQPQATFPNQRPQSSYQATSGQLQPQRASTVQPERASRNEQQDKGFKLFGKKRSKSQSAVSHPPGAFDGAQANYTLTNRSSMTLGSSAAANPSGSASALSNKTMASTTGPDSGNAPSPAESSKSTGSKWRPFGKKKSKSFSGGLNQVMAQGTQSSVELPPSLPPLALGTNIPDTTSSSEYFTETSQKRPTEGRRGSQDNTSTLYDRDEEDDVDPFYVVDVKGRAKAFEGKDSGKIRKQASGTVSSAKEDLKKVPKKPALKQSTSSYSNQQPFAPTFSPGTFTQQTSVSQQDLASPRFSGVMYNSSNAGSTASLGTPTRRHSQDRRRTMDIYTSSFIDDCDSEAVLQMNSTPMQMRLQQDPRHQMLITPQSGSIQPVQEISMDSPIATHLWPVTDQQDDLVVEDQMATNIEEETGEKSKGKQKLSNKPNEQTPEKLDDVLKLMDEVLFGGSSPTAKKNDTVARNSQQQQPMTGGPIITPRKESLVDYSTSAVSQAHGNAAPISEAPTGFVFEEPREIVLKDENESGPTQSPATSTQSHNPLSPIAYEPRTTYKSKKIVQKVSQKGKDGEQLSPTFSESSNEHATSTSVSDEKQVHLRESGDLAAAESSDKTKVENSNKLTMEFSGSPLSVSISRFEPVKSPESEKLATEPVMTKSSTNGSIAMALFKSSIGKGKKKEEEEYVPYEYQEEVEGPLMERVKVPETQETVGFVMPIEESKPTHMQNSNNSAGADNWDSWVTQLESFERVLVDKGLQNDRLKSKTPGPAYFEPQSPMPTPIQISGLDSGSSTTGSAYSSRPGTSMTNTSRPSTTMTADTSLATTPTVEYTENPLGGTIKNSDAAECEMDANNRQGDNGDNNTIERRESLQSSTSTATAVGQRLTVQPMIVQQAKKQWWAPQRKDINPVDEDGEDDASNSDQEQERHLALLLNSRNLQDQLDAAMEAAARTSESDSIISSESSCSSSSSIVTARHVSASPLKSTMQSVGKMIKSGSDLELDDNEDSRVAPMPKPKAQPKGAKSKLLPISTPLSHLLQLNNPDELWKYAQQAKAFATTKMNKGDKRSAAIALKRAKALESRWQEVLLEMASSDDDEDALLEDDEDEMDGNEGDANDKGEQERSRTLTNEQEVVIKDEVATVDPIVIRVQEDDRESTDEEDQTYSVRRDLNKRGEGVPDNYSKYKVNKDMVATTVGDEKETNDDNDPQLGPEVTIEQMLACENPKHVMHYIQKLKTDTVTKARAGSKMEALQGMKNVKLLQQRLEENAKKLPPRFDPFSLVTMSTLPPTGSQGSGNSVPPSNSSGASGLGAEEIAKAHQQPSQQPPQSPHSHPPPPQQKPPSVFSRAWKHRGKITFGIFVFYSSATLFHSIVETDTDKSYYQKLAQAAASGGSTPTPTSTLIDIVAALKQAKDDPRIVGIMANFSTGNQSKSGSSKGLGLAQIQELRSAVQEFKEAKAKALGGEDKVSLIAYTDSFGKYNQQQYYLASAFDKVYMQPTGSIPLVGLSSTVPFFKTLLNRFGILVRAEARKEYKSMVSPFTETELPQAQKQNLFDLLKGLNAQILTDIAKARQKALGSDPVEKLNHLIQVGPFMGAESKDEGLVDGLLYKHDCGKMVENNGAFGLTHYMKVKAKEHKAQTAKSKTPSLVVGVVYLIGGIKRGGGEFGANTIVKGIREAANDSTVDAVVLRIDSGGGDVVASDTIGEAIRWCQDVKKKPVVVSFGNVSASGGYYVSTHAKAIVAQPTTITGSIGVAAMRPYFTPEFFKMIGVSVEQFFTGSSDTSFLTDLEGAALTRYKRQIDSIYADFLKRVADGRKMSLDQVEGVAGGRVMNGKEALKVGLVDKMGGIYDSIRLAGQYGLDVHKQKGTVPSDLKISDVVVKVFPSPKPLLQQIVDTMTGDEAKDMYAKEHMRALMMRVWSGDLMGLMQDFGLSSSRGWVTGQHMPRHQLELDLEGLDLD